MNIYDYFMSNDVAQYCKSIGHNFNTIEMAWIIDQSDKNVKEKNMAFRELIDNYPDMPFHESVDFCVKTSIQDYLRALIEYRERLIENFEDSTNTSKTCYYIYSFWYDKNIKIREKLSGNRIVFSTIKEALNFTCLHRKDEIQEYNFVRIFREISSKYKDIVYLDYNYNKDVIRVADKYNLNKKSELNNIIPNGPGDLHHLFIHIPSPFKEGDIVAVESAPVVIKALPHTAKNYNELISGSKCKPYPFSDRPEYAIYYYLNKAGILVDSFPGAHTIKSPYSNGFGMPAEKLEYYKKPLKDKEKILLELSKFIKENRTQNAKDWYKSFTDILCRKPLDKLNYLKTATNKSIDDIDICDQSIYKLFADKNTTGVYEFDTDNTRDILSCISVKKFSDLVKIIGLARGVGTWEDNGNNLIKDKTATFNKLISSAEDVYEMLRVKGVANDVAWEISKQVQQGIFGKFCTEADYIMLLNTGVPEWYVESMKKIKYLFPKEQMIMNALNAAYLAWFKANYPAEFDDACLQFDA